MDRRTSDDHPQPRPESGPGADAASEAGFIPLPMRPPRLRGGDPPAEPHERGDDDATRSA